MSKSRDSQVEWENKPGEKNTLWMATIPICTIINLGMGTLTLHLKLPIYLDTTGTLLASLLSGIPSGVFTGIASSLLGGLLVNPIVPYYTGTQVAIAIFSGSLAKRGLFRSISTIAVAGILLGIVAGVVSAPVVILFGGFTGTCTDITTTILLAAGESFAKSVFLSNFANEPLDKILQCLLVFWLIKNLPHNVRNRFANIGYLKQNLLCNKSF